LPAQRSVSIERGATIMTVSRFLQRMLNPHARLVEQASAQPESPLQLPVDIFVNEQAITLRLMTAADTAAIGEFARSLPPDDLLFLRRDITRAEDVSTWVHEINAGLVTTVLAIAANRRVVGYATVASDGLTWTRHVRELRVMVTPELRGMQLGRVLTAQAFAIAKQQGAKKMVAQMTTDQRSAIAVFSAMGFQSEARLRGQVVDRAGHPHDLEIMSLDIDDFDARLELALLAVQTDLV
jgi:L-amino acid N-acyltransferase YncA